MSNAGSSSPTRALSPATNGGSPVPVFGVTAANGPAPTRPSALLATAVVTNPPTPVYGVLAATAPIVAPSPSHVVHHPRPVEMYDGVVNPAGVYEDIISG